MKEIVMITLLTVAILYGLIWTISEMVKQQEAFNNFRAVCNQNGGYLIEGGTTNGGFSTRYQCVKEGKFIQI